MTATGSNRGLVRLGVVVGLVAIFGVLWLTGLLVTVKPIGQTKSLAAVMGGGHAFDKVKYVDSIWTSRVLPTVEEHSIGLDALVSALEKNPAEACKEYGHSVGGTYSFLVSFAGSVTKVDTSTPLGSLLVDVPLSGAMLPVRVQIGPVILGTSIRDALKFISFEQFLNQMQYGSVADELNSRVEQDVLSKLDLKTLTGKRIGVKGAFTFDGTNPKNVVVTPITLTVK